MVSGASPSSVLTSTISPESGAMTSDTALTDSTSAYESPAVIVEPTSGGSKKTTSPRASWANQVMPSVAVSPSTRAQSCSGWYSRSSGYVPSAIALLVWSVQRAALDARVAQLAADVDLDRGAGLGAVGGHVGHADADAEARGQRAAGHLAAVGDGVALPGDPR